MSSSVFILYPNIQRGLRHQIYDETVQDNQENLVKFLFFRASKLLDSITEIQ